MLLHKITLVPCGLVKVIVRSFIQLCVPVKLITFTSKIVPLVGIVMVDVTVGVPVAVMLIGIFVLIVVAQLVFAVVKENAVEKAAEPQAV